MREEFLHFLWQFRLFERGQWQTTEGEPLEVIFPGNLNLDAGPDFLNARIRIGHTEWAGHVEFHLKTSDWQSHGHQNDRAYDNVILHVVHRKNADLGPSCATWVCARYVPEAYLQNWEQLRKSKQRIPCANLLSKTDLSSAFGWTGRLAIQRLERKSASIFSKLAAEKGDFRVVFYQLLMRYLGFRVNKEAFELLADTLPLSALEKHSNSLIQLEALLFGQAGFLEAEDADAYHATLKREFAMLRAKFNLIPMDVSVWKFSKIMPRNFPTIRLAQAAAIIHSRQGLVSVVSEYSDVSDFERVFKIPVSDYWRHHYGFGKQLKKSNSGIPGQMTRSLLIINVVVPFKFVLGKYHGRQEMIDQAIQLLESLPPEQNSIIKMWKTLSLVPDSALESQGLLELKNEYCNSKKCLSCRFGQQIIKGAT